MRVQKENMLWEEPILEAQSEPLQASWPVCSHHKHIWLYRKFGIKAREFLPFHGVRIPFQKAMQLVRRYAFGLPRPLHRL